VLQTGDENMTGRNQGRLEELHRDGGLPTTTKGLLPLSLAVVLVGCITPAPSDDCRSGSRFSQRAEFVLEPFGTRGGETQWESRLRWSLNDEGTEFSGWSLQGTATFLSEPGFFAASVLSEVGSDVIATADWTCQAVGGSIEVFFPGEELALEVETPGTVTEL